jgi:hypothetical protein
MGLPEDKNYFKFLMNVSTCTCVLQIDTVAKLCGYIPFMKIDFTHYFKLTLQIRRL